MIFILFGDVCSVDRIVKKVQSGRLRWYMNDQWPESKEVSVEYLKEHTEANGIISTKKPSLIKKAKELGMLPILR